MASVNRVILLGHLGRDPETRYAQSGVAICNLSLATSRSRTDKASGEKREETEWHRIVLYDRLAEIAGEYLRKGRPAYIAAASPDTIAALLAERDALREALEKLARLGNGDRYGNSIWNMIARDALAMGDTDAR